MLGKMVEVGFGVDSGLDVVSDATGYWPVLLLQQLLGVQLMRSADSSRRHPVSSPEGKTGPTRIVSLTDWRREEVT